MCPASGSATRRMRGSPPALPSFCSTSRPSPRSTCAAAARARARPICSTRKCRCSASTRSRFRAARRLGSTHRAACRRCCASRAAAIRSAPRACRSCPGAILFDLLNGGDKDWGRYPPYRELAYTAAANAGEEFALGSVGAGTGATTVNLKGGIGSASAVTADGFTVGALAAVNAAGSVVVGDGPWFWAAPVRTEWRVRRVGLPLADPARRAAPAHQRRVPGEHGARSPSQPMRS